MLAATHILHQLHQRSYRCLHFSLSLSLLFSNWSILTVHHHHHSFIVFFLSFRCHGSGTATRTSWQWIATPSSQTSGSRHGTRRRRRRGRYRCGMYRSGTPASTSVRCPRSPRWATSSTWVSSVSLEKLSLHFTLAWVRRRTFSLSSSA